MKQIAESKIEELLAAAKQAKASELTLCIDTDLQWAIEPGTSWLPNQLCRVGENYSPIGLREFLNESFAAIRQGGRDEQCF